MSRPMRFRCNARAILALAVAYSLALQAILLAVAGPVGGGLAFAAAPI